MQYIRPYLTKGSIVAFDELAHAKWPGETSALRDTLGTDACRLRLLPGHATPAYLEAGWRDAAGEGDWVWHSLRHVFCTTALFTWKLEAADVSRMAGHANVRTALDMYVGATAGVLDRARAATE